MGVERLARGLVVVRVVHPAGDGGVVVAEDGVLRGLADEVAALVRRPAVTDGVAEAEVLVDPLRLEGLEHRAQRFDVRVDVEKIPIRIRRSEHTRKPALGLDQIGLVELGLGFFFVVDDQVGVVEQLHRGGDVDLEPG